MGTRVADTTSAGLDRAHSPLVLAVNFALVVLGSAAKVGGGRCLLSGGHGGRCSRGRQGVVVVDGDDECADRRLWVQRSALIGRWIWVEP
jgi:hypothetical protein